MPKKSNPLPKSAQALMKAGIPQRKAMAYPPKSKGAK